MSTTWWIEWNKWPVLVWDGSNIFMLSINENKNNENCRELKEKIFHSEWQEIIIQLREPPINEVIKEIITNTEDLVPRIEKWLFQDKRLSLVCIDSSEELTYSFI